jgi:hypothetical protein
MMMLRRSTRLADQLDAALDGRAVALPDELVALVALAERIRDAARGLEPDPADLACAPIPGTCRLAAPTPNWPAHPGARRPTTGRDR